MSQTLTNAIVPDLIAVGLHPRKVAVLAEGAAPGAAKLSVGDQIFALAETTPYVPMTATGIAVNGACELAGFDCIVAAGNITIYDGTDSSGNVIVPTTALVQGRTEFQYKRSLGVGCYVVLSGAATVNVLVG